MRVAGILCTLFIGVVLAQQQNGHGSVAELEIDVNSGQVTEIERSSASVQHAAGETFDAWPENLEVDGITITGHEGEDAKESMGPRELILRAFAKLPAEVQDSMGFTSLLSDAAASGETVSLEALRELWDRRQALLKQAADTMSDSAKVLAKLIARLDAASASFPDGGDDQGTSVTFESGEESAEDEALLVLRDLEDYLSDVDNARDFHDALGGWPVLLDRLAPRPRWRLVVAPGTTKAAAAAAASTATQSRPPNPPRVRAEAALVVGTAIKNIDSFRNWVLESTVVDVPAEDESAVAETIAAVDRASQKKEYPSSEVPANITAVSALVGLLGGDSGTPTAAQLLLLRRRGVYALGAALRNNPVAQAAFLELGGLEHLRLAALDSASTSPAGDNNDDATSIAAWCDSAPSSVWALRGKVLALALDFLHEEKAVRDERGTASASTLKTRAAASGFVTPLEALAREATSLSWRQTASVALGASCPTGLDGPPLKVTETALQLLAAQWDQLLDAADPQDGDLSAVDSATIAAASITAELRGDAALLREGAQALNQKFQRMVADSASGSDEDSDGISAEYIVELRAHAEALLAILNRIE